MSSSYTTFIRELVESVESNIQELTDRKGFAEADEFDHIEGKLIAYREILAMLRSGASEHSLPLTDLGL